MANEQIRFKDVQIIRNPINRGNGEPTHVNMNLGGKLIDNGRFKSNARYFSIRVPDEMVDLLKSMHVVMWNPKTPDENGNIIYCVTIGISVKEATPKTPAQLRCQVYLVDEYNKRTELDKDTIGICDDPRFNIKHVRVQCGVAPKQDDPNFCKLWANVLYIFKGPQADDPWNDEFLDNDDTPFDE
jgi:hypothetical protein